MNPSNTLNLRYPPSQGCAPVPETPFEAPFAHRCSLREQVEPPGRKGQKWSLGISASTEMFEDVTEKRL